MSGSLADLATTATNDDAVARRVGEYVSSRVPQGSAVALTTDVAADVTSILLSAGDWDVSAVIKFTGGATTTVNWLIGSLSTAPLALDTSGLGRDTRVVGAAATLFAYTSPQFMVGPARFSLALPTTVYLVADAEFGVSTATAFGEIYARRVR